MRIDSAGMRTDLALLELQDATVTDHSDHLVIRTESNPTFWWGNFLLLETARPDDIDHWIDRFEAEFPDAGHRTFGILDIDTDRSGWQERGFDVGVDITLTAEPATIIETDIRPGMPDVELREIHSDDDWEQLARLGCVDIEPDGLEDRMVFERRRAAAQRKLVETGAGTWLGAFVAGRLVAKLGIVRVGELARYQDVVTDPAHRRQGLAGALIRRGAAKAVEWAGVTRLVIVAEEDGPAIDVYRKAGFIDTDRTIGVEKAP